MGTTTHEQATAQERRKAVASRKATREQWRAWMSQLRRAEWIMRGPGAKSNALARQWRRDRQRMGSRWARRTIQRMRVLDRARCSEPPSSAPT